MSMQTLRELIDRLGAAAAGLAGLGAALDAKATGSALDPTVAARVHELLGALGAGDALAGIGTAEAAQLAADIRFTYGLDAKLLQAPITGWSHTEPAILIAGGEVGRTHAFAITRGIAPALPGLADRLGAPDGAFLDIGAGAGGLAVGMAELWPALRIVGIEPWRPSLALARDAVRRAGFDGRIELREQGAEALEDEDVFDLVWVPTPFMPERVLVPTLERSRRALRRGGWIVVAFANVENRDPQTVALWKLRTTMWGGPVLTPRLVEELLGANGYPEVRTLPGPPGSIVGLVAGRRV